MIEYKPVTFIFANANAIYTTFVVVARNIIINDARQVLCVRIISLEISQICVRFTLRYVVVGIEVRGCYSRCDGHCYTGVVAIVISSVILLCYYNLSL